ncbi:MAG: GGDEF domain-containing protein, partial [Oscillospiraceae bacterium]
FGHYTGDQVLQGVARLLRKVFSEYNIVGRLGGDEFIIFMQGNSNRSIIKDKCSLLHKELEINSLKWQTSVTLSIGAAIAKPKIDYNSLYQEADKALYTVKSLGRNGFHISESDIS